MKLPAWFRDVSIRRKLMFIAFLATLAATLFAMLALTVMQWFLLRDDLVKSIHAQAAIVATNSVSALLFNDTEAAQQTMGALAVIDNIEFAELLDKTGKRLAAYERPGVVMPPHQHTAEDERGHIHTLTNLEVVIPVVFKQERIGTIHVRSNLAPVYEKLAWDILVIVVAATGALLVALLMLLRMLPAITDPLQYLVKLMNTVSQENNYTLRAELHGKDEVGTLAQRFNNMLAQIQARDNTLKQQREHLEDEVAQRTADLQKTNITLEQELTERKQIEEQLRETRDYLGNLFNYANAPIIVWNPSYQITMFNHAFERLTGRQAAEFIGKPIDILFPDVHRDEALAKIHRTTRTGERWETVEIPIQHASGAVKTALWNSATLYSADGQQVLATIAQGQDITERKQAEDEIRQLNEELDAKVKQRTQQLLEAQDELVRKEKLAVLGQVAGSVGHELRNPLGVMNNAVYFLQTVLEDADDSVKEYLNIIKNEIAGSERIVSDLLDSVRTKPPHPEIVGLRELLEQTLDKLDIPSNVTVKLDIPETLPALRVDAQQIHQVLRNLISNGIEAMPEGGTLEIRAVADEALKSITVSVRDNGSGIAPEILPKLFQPLFTTKARGIGLGLVVVKNLTEANGGTVKVESEPGKGTQFAVTLTAADGSGITI